MASKSQASAPAIFIRCIRAGLDSKGTYYIGDVGGDGDGGREGGLGNRQVHPEIRFCKMAAPAKRPPK